MKTSVACCLYNGARYLQQQLDSLVAQSVRPDEIVIVDDGSVDDSPRIAEDFARAAPDGIDVIVVRNPVNLGVVANFEKALSLTTGALVFLCDQDDVWVPSKIETMTRVFDMRDDLLLLFSDARLIDEAGRALPHTLFEALEVTARERRLLREHRPFAALIGRNVVTGATAVVRRAVIDAARPFPPEWVHDEWLAIVAAALGSVDYLPMPLIDYRQHDANQIGVHRLTLTEKWTKLFKHRAERYRTLQRRAEILLRRIDDLGSRSSPDHLRLAAGKLAHVQVRATLPDNRVRRAPRIAREVAAGRYTRYSSGFRSIVRDCLEPA